ncbi:hypothetical protein [Terricaulis sp.]|uniref:hypothetical protein n=1 Tax=Terricaulis sp. TaxID=2768686 RepID=UPI002AC5746E|nr:hypothetical protein [Terricaulis sp.]MDZ4690286.1 hypothetical protein [Terricaulis sp.]
MHVEFQPVQLVCNSDADGRLVFCDGQFAGVLSQLSDQYAEFAGRWFLEFGLGPLAFQEADFADLVDAAQWIERRLAT